MPAFESPAPVDGAPREIAIFRDYLTQCRGTAAIAPRSAFDPIQVPRLLPYLFLVDLVDDGQDFRYRLIGGHIREHSPTNFVGRRLSEIRDIGSQGRLLEIYRQVVTEAAPVAARIPYATPELAAASHYDLLVVPLADDTGRLFQLIGIAVYGD